MKYLAMSTNTFKLSVIILAVILCEVQFYSFVNSYDQQQLHHKTLLQVSLRPAIFSLPSEKKGRVKEPEIAKKQEIKKEKYYHTGLERISQTENENFTDNKSRKNRPQLNTTQNNNEILLESNFTLVSSMEVGQITSVYQDEHLRVKASRSNGLEFQRRSEKKNARYNLFLINPIHSNGNSMNYAYSKKYFPVERLIRKRNIQTDTGNFHSNFDSDVPQTVSTTDSNLHIKIQESKKKFSSSVFNRSAESELKSAIHSQYDGESSHSHIFKNYSTASETLAKTMNTSTHSSPEVKDSFENITEDERNFDARVGFDSSTNMNNATLVFSTSHDERKQTRQETPTKRNDQVDKFYAKYPVGLWKTVGLFEDSYIKRIDSHWLEYDPAKPLVHKILSILYGLFMIIGCSGNLLVIIMFFRCRSLRTPANYLVLNLAVSDFMMMAKAPIFIYNSFYGGPVLGTVGCNVYGFVGGLSGTASIMTLTTISVDRYYAIVHPLNPFKRITSTRAFLMITGVWIYSAFFSSMPLLGLNRYVSEGYLTSCSFDYLSTDISSRLFVFIYFVAAWLLPLCVISFSYIRIFMIVRAAAKSEFLGEGQLQRFKSKRNKEKNTELKIAIVTSVIICLWLLAWTPYAVVALLGIFGLKRFITPLVSAVPAFFCKTASCVDPFIYSINHPRFQRELRNKFNTIFKRQGTQNTSRETSYYSASGRDDGNSIRVGSGNSRILRRNPHNKSFYKSKESIRMTSVTNYNAASADCSRNNSVVKVGSGMIKMDQLNSEGSILVRRETNELELKKDLTTSTLVSQEKESGMDYEKLIKTVFNSSTKSDQKNVVFVSTIYHANSLPTLNAKSFFNIDQKNLSQ